MDQQGSSRDAGSQMGLMRRAGMRGQHPLRLSLGRAEAQPLVVPRRRAHVALNVSDTQHSVHTRSAAHMQVLATRGFVPANMARTR